MNRRSLRTKAGNALINLGLRVMPPKEALQVATGDRLTRMAAIYGLTRETDEELRERVLVFIKGIETKARRCKK